MLTAHHLTKSYGIQPVLQGISFSLSAGEHTGLIGPNGRGTVLAVVHDRYFIKHFAQDISTVADGKVQKW